MPFDFKWLSMVQQTQVYDPTHNSSVGVVESTTPKNYNFNASATGANNSTAETQAADYFLRAFAVLNVGDKIYINSNNPGFHDVAVTASTANTVTVAQIA